MQHDVDELIDALHARLAGPSRGRLLDVLTEGGTRSPLKRLRSAMGSHTFAAGADSFDVARLVRRLDKRTRQDGFRVLHAWNHRTHSFTDDIVPALILDFMERARGEGDIDAEAARVTASIVLDYYFLHLLALCAVRVWDTANPDRSLDHVHEVLGALQGEHGSGHQFVADAETLIIYALSQFHPEETAYDRIIDRVSALSDAHQLAFATASASVLSAHLRWGFWLMYGRDVVRMRRDNVGDYPWLLYSILTLARAYRALVDAGDAVDRTEVTQALLQGLAADPWAFRGKAPPALADHGAEYAEVLEILRSHRSQLVEDLSLLEPDKRRYAPLALHFNFPHNTVVAIVTLALLEGRPQTLPLNALFTGAPDIDDDSGPESREQLARTLMAFSRGSPDRLGYRGAMLVAYDPLSGMRSFSMTMEILRAEDSERLS